MVDTRLKPRLALNVGVTGHCYLEHIELEALNKIIDNVLCGIAEAYVVLAKSDEFGEIFDKKTPETPEGQGLALRLLSSLALGADRIVAERALSLRPLCSERDSEMLSYELQCILPFPAQEYALVFPGTEPKFWELLSKADRVLEFDCKRISNADKNHAYWQAGYTLLRHSDILLAI